MTKSLFTHRLQHWRSRHYQPLQNWIFATTELFFSFRKFWKNLSVHRTSDYSGIWTSHVFSPGIEPGLTAWKSRALTTQPVIRNLLEKIDCPGNWTPDLNKQKSTEASLYVFVNNITYYIHSCIITNIIDPDEHYEKYNFLAFHTCSIVFCFSSSPFRLVCVKETEKLKD